MPSSSGSVAWIYVIQQMTLTSRHKSWSMMPSTCSGCRGWETSYVSSNCSPGATQPLSIFGSMICARINIKSAKYDILDQCHSPPGLQQPQKE